MRNAEYGRMFEAEETHWWYVSLHELILRSLPRHDAGMRMLDAGCGTGRLLQLLSSRGPAVGCDASLQAVTFCRKRGLRSVVLADLNTVVLQKDAFDVIASVDVLYHQWITDDRSVLAKFQEALRPGGTLVLHLPAHEWLRSTHDVAVQTGRRYQRKRLLAMLEGCGFTVEKATYRVSILFLPIVVMRLLKRMVPQASAAAPRPSDVRKHSRVVNRLLTAVMRFENRLLDSLTFPFGCSIFVVARKGPGPAYAAPGDRQ